MSPRYRFDLATPQDDAALRAVLSATAMPGGISVSFQREPSFFTAERAGNLASQVIVVREAETGSIVGVGCRSLRKMFIDGDAREAGYLSNLRGLAPVRGGTLLARGYRFLKELHADGRAPYYVTTILDDNRYARELLNSRRAGLPVYHPLGRLYTYLLPLYGWRNRGSPSDAVVSVTTDCLRVQAVKCLNDFNRRHQFAPCYQIQDFQGASPTLPGFDPEYFYAYQDGRDVTATLGVWDQTPFKQTVVTAYSWRYRLARRLGVLGAPLGLMARLPETGQPIRYLYGAFLSHRPGGEDHLESLLRFALNRWSRKGYAYLALGVHERSPLDGLLRRYAVSRLTSMVYLVYWPELLDCSLPSPDPIPHFEIATL